MKGMERRARDHSRGSGESLIIVFTPTPTEGVWEGARITGAIVSGPGMPGHICFFSLSRHRQHMTDVLFSGQIVVIIRDGKIKVH